MIKKIYKHYMKIPASVKASIWFVVCNAFQKGIQFITVPIFTRLMTTEQYGQYTVYQSWLGIVSIFATLNLSAGVFNNGMLKYKANREKYIASMQGLSTTSTLCVIFLYLLTSNLCDKLFGMPHVLTAAMFMEMLFSPALQYWSMRQRYEFKYHALVVVTLSISVLNPLLGLLAVYATEEKGIARVLSSAIVNIGVGLAFYIYNLIKGKKWYDKQIWIFALTFNIPLIPHYLSSIILAQSDRIMIEKMFGESKVAIYGVAYSISMAMNIIVSSINSSFAPWTYQKCADKNYLAIGEISNILLIFMGTICLLPVVVAPELMRIVAPASYAEAVWIIPPVSLSVYFIFLYSLFGNIEFFFEETKFIMTASVIGAVSNIILNAIFMPAFGYIAAGYTTLFCYIIFAYAHYRFMLKTCQEHIKALHIYSAKTILLTTSLLFVVCGMTMVFYRLPLIRYGILLIGGIITFLFRKRIVWLYKAIKAIKSKGDSRNPH